MEEIKILIKFVLYFFYIPHNIKLKLKLFDAMLIRMVVSKFKILEEYDKIKYF